MITLLNLEGLKGMKASAINNLASELLLKIKPDAQPLKRTATLPDAMKRYLKLAQDYNLAHPRTATEPVKKRGPKMKNPEAGSKARDPGDRFMKMRFKLVYDPGHPKRVICHEKVKGELVGITQADAIHRFERMGRLILDRWAGALADGKAEQIMTGKQIIALLEHGRATHFPSCKSSLYRAFQNYMTVFGVRSERTPKGLGLVEKMAAADE